MNKKAQVKEMMLYIYRFVYLIIILGIVVFLIKFMVFTDLSTDWLEADVLGSQIINTQAINYADPVTGRIYPGIIDFAKFESQNIDDALYYTNQEHIGAKLELYDVSQTYKTVYLNKKFYDQKAVLGLAGVKGSGSVTIFKKSYPVVFFKDNTFTDAWLNITIARQND